MLSTLSFERNPSAPVTEDSLASARRAARMVASASKEGVFHGKCLEQSMVLWFVLKQRQLPADLQIGGRRTAGRLEAHAWVELEGNVINDRHTVAQDFARLSNEVDSVRAESR